MGTGNADAEEAVLNMLQRYEFDTFFKGHIQCYTHYSCFGLLLAFQWLWLA